MKYKKRKWLWMAVAGPIILLLLGGILLPVLVNFQPLKDRVQNELSQKIGGRITGAKIELSLLPAPHVSFQQIDFSIGETISGAVQSLTVYPRILPLLRGELRLAEVQLGAPDLTIQSPTAPAASSRGEPGTTAANLRAKLILVLKDLASRAPALTVQVENGTLQFMAGGDDLISLQNVNGRLRLPPEQLDLEVTCGSNLWQDFSLAVQVDANLAAEGTIRVAALRPQRLLSHLFPSAPVKVADSLADLNVHFSATGHGAIQADLQGSAPYLTLIRQDEKAVIKCRSLKGFLQMSEGKTIVQIEELLLDDPHLSLSGTFSREKNPARYALELKGAEVDVVSTRQAALALLGEFVNTRKIFEIIQGGTVPDITFSTRGNQPHELGDSKNIHITGTMHNGNIFVPKAELDLTGVYGTVDITNGILQGEKLQARLGNSLGTDASLRIGLVGKNAPFHLDIDISADLVQLPPILQRVVKNKRFTDEIGLIDAFTGSARGRMVLGEKLGSVNALVDVRELQVAASYQRLPYPLQLQKGRFFYDGTKRVVAVQDLAGSLGGSSFSAFSGQLDWASEMQLQIGSRKATLFVPEVYPWVTSYPQIAQRLKEFKFGRGTVTIDELSLKGPLLSPQNWQFSVTGSVQDLAVDWTFFPSTLLISHGDFSGAPHTLRFVDSQASLLDASFRASADLEELRQSLQAAELTITGTLGAKAIQWIAGLGNLPPQLNLRAPLSIAQGSLIWKRGAETSFTGEVTPAGGPKVTVDQTRQKDRLTIKRLHIEDQESNASISLDLTPQELDLTFSGNLTKDTADNLLQDNQILAGWINGDFSARVPLRRFMASTARGDLKGYALHVPGIKGLNAVKYFTVKALENRLNVQSATLVWEDNQLVVNGAVDFAANGPLLDLNVALDSIEWSEVQRALRCVKENTGQSEQLKRLEARGTVKVYANSFAFDRFTWQPFQADLHLAPRGMEVSIAKAALCGVSTPGTVRQSNGNLQMAIDASARNQPLAPTLACLWDQKGLMQGNFSFDGDISGQLATDSFVRSLQGDIHFEAENGRIYRFGLLEKVFSVLNFTEIFRGKLPDLAQEGFGYESFQIKGSLQDGNIDIEEAILKGSSMEMVGRGTVSMMDKKIDLTILVAPLKTLNVVISHIPVVNGVLGSIVSVPVGVTGELSDPLVIPLSPSAVGSELLGIMKKTFELPMKIIQPLMPAENKKAKTEAGAQKPQEPVE